MTPSDPSGTAAYYAKHAEEYFARTSRVNMSSVYAPFEERLTAGARILDLGCGSGRDARHLAAHGHRVVALDPCREMLALAAQHTPGDLRDRIDYVVGAAPSLALEDACFDAVWACASLLHLARREMPTALVECRRVLRRGGLLLLAVKEGDGETDDDGRICVFWRAPELNGLMVEAGYSVVNATRRRSLDGRDLTWIDVLAEAR